MNEFEFRQKWEADKSVYSAWGEFIVETIKGSLITSGKDIDSFLKSPAKFRLKDDTSLIDKAFYRGKKYSNPYSEIEDKVGVRFVVLLVEDIAEICKLIESSDAWDFDACKHFNEDKKNEPLLFTYQSVHYILRPKSLLVSDTIEIPADTPCEVQIRTLLQHAHAELTHDAIYKAKKAVRPDVHRLVAKSMALIETTDEFFSQATKGINYGPLEEYNILARLDSVYYSLTGLNSHAQKSTLVLWDEFEDLIGPDLVDNISKFASSHGSLCESIKVKYGQNVFYQQSSILFVYWMLDRKKRRLVSDWPLSAAILDGLATDMFISLDN